MPAENSHPDIGTGEVSPLGQRLKQLRRRLPIVVAVTVFCTLAASAASYLSTTEYTATAQLLFRDSQFDEAVFGVTVLSPSNDPAREAATNARLVDLPSVAFRASRSLGIPVSAVRSQVTVTGQGVSDIVAIAATSPSPRLAQRIANTFALQFIAFRREADRNKMAATLSLVNRQLAKLGPTNRDSVQGRSLRRRQEQLQILSSLQTGNAELVQPAGLPTSPSGPQRFRDAALGFTFGLLLGIVIALVVDSLDRKLKAPEDLEAIFDRPVLGSIPASRALAKEGRKLNSLGAGEIDAFQLLRSNLRFFNFDRELRSILVTSPGPGDGKSTIAWGIAAAAAQAGDRVVLVDADFRRASVQRQVGLTPHAGLTSVLTGALTIDEVIESVEVGGAESTVTMDVVTAGPKPPNPADLLDSHRAHEALAALVARYDLVVIDTPPTTVVPDAIPLLRRVDGIIVVGRLGRTRKDVARRLRVHVENLQAPVLGIVVNGVTARWGYAYGYGYAYDSRTGPTPETERNPT